uniref:Xylanase inhibitor N-terminal domain-containing protein n=1 Tax=Quercus lobata TaxID=97700 RepID=A0A7N2KUF2_QUELO
MWTSLNPRGKTVFLKEDPKWFQTVLKDSSYLKANTVKYRTQLSQADDLLSSYSSEHPCSSFDAYLRCNTWCRLVLENLPYEVYETKWDLIMIETPRGYFVEEQDGNKLRESQATTLPDNSGLTIGMGIYIVTVGLGTPKTDQKLAFDTGSPRKCSTNSQCVYNKHYNDKSYTVGYFSKKRLTITSDVVDNFIFGCGQTNESLFGGIAGLLGLGRSQVSLCTTSCTKVQEVFLILSSFHN